MTPKARTATVICIVFAASVAFTLVIFSLLQENQHALKKAAIASEIMFEVFERRLLADEYAQGGSERAKSQWVAKQSILENIVSANEILFEAQTEKDILVRLKENIAQTKGVFQELTTLYEEEFLERTQFFEAKSARLSSQLSVKSQETIAAARSLKEINDKNAANIFQKILILFSVAGGLLIVLLIGGFLEIWRNTHALERKRSESEAMLSGIGDGVFVVDNQKKLLVFNGAASAISGFTEKEAIGSYYHDILKFVDEKTKLEKRNFIETALSGKKANMPGETELITKSGTSIPVADSAAPIFGEEGDVVGAVVVFRDRSLEYQAEKLKAQILYRTIHDLRAPATAIKLAAENYSDAGMLAENPDQLKEGIRFINEANERMLALVNDLLKSAQEKSQAAGQPKDEQDIDKIIRSIIEESKIIAQQKKVEIVYMPPRQLPKVFGHPIKLQEIFANLINNAIKYNKEGGKVFVSLTPEDFVVLVEIHDTGFGIPQSEQGKIFQEFFRASGEATAQAPGTGLGLSSTKALVEEMGGEIGFTSVEGFGTTFAVSLLNARKIT